MTALRPALSILILLSVVGGYTGCANCNDHAPSSAGESATTVNGGANEGASESVHKFEPRPRKRIFPRGIKFVDGSLRHGPAE